MAGESDETTDEGAKQEENGEPKTETETEVATTEDGKPEERSEAKPEGQKSEGRLDVMTLLDEPKRERNVEEGEGEGDKKIDTLKESRHWTIHSLPLSELSEDEQIEDYKAGVCLEEKFDEEDLTKLHEAFLKIPNEKMNLDQLKNSLRDVGRIVMTDEEYEVLFMKMDSKRDSYIDWDEFVSHLLLEFQEKEAATTQQTLTLPLEGYPKIVKSNHRHPLVRITFCPAVEQDRSINYLHGKYISASHDGHINYWNVDMELERSVKSESVQLKVQSTWVTDICCLPDVNIVCTCSTERELRFYDTTANKFELRILITSMEYPVTCMGYHFNQDISVDSVLLLGDLGGCIRNLFFNSKQKGPFYHTPGIDVTRLYYDELLLGGLPGMKVVEFKNIHLESVRQVQYYNALHSFLSCAPCAENSLFLSDAYGTKSKHSFNVPRGITCFNFSEESHIIATGGPDCVVRIWSAFIPKKPLVVFQGHHAAICSIIMQEEGQKVYSLSKDRCIKVWNVQDQVCIQTYIKIPTEIGEKTPLATYYNPLNRNFIIGSIRIAIMICGRLIDKEETDGYTHSKPVTKALYNPLFKCIVTVGLDSCIIVWDPWNGRRLNLVKEAHTRILYGETKSVEITAATFDPTNQLLLTGARDGTIKMWNFNTGTCIKHMEIEKNCEVTSVTWLRGRILAVGWNMHVTEFSDTGRFTHGKAWETRHNDDVLCAAVRIPHSIVTSSYSGELVFWTLETGQAYARYNVSKPHERLKLGFMRSRSKSSKSSSAGSTRGATKDKATDMSMKRKGSIAPAQFKAAQAQAHAQAQAIAQAEAAQQAADKRKARRVSVIQLPDSGAAMRPLSVHAMLFLQTRPMQPDVGTLFIALENGNVQVWSHHSGGGYIGCFFAIHVAGDYVVAMTTDPDNEYLFTGTTAGYVKIWLMKNYMFPWPVKIIMPIYRLQFPFTWKDRVEGRAKRVVREQPLPILLSSYKAHLRAITHIEYIPSCKIVVSCSSDTTVRLWSLSGRYLATLGTELPWPKLRPDREPVNLNFRFPPDIKKIGSSLTMKVLKGGNVPRTSLAKPNEEDVVREIPKKILLRGTYGNRVIPPILGKFFELPPKVRGPSRLPVLDSSLPYIPVYCHLKLYPVEDVERPPTPEVIQELRIMKDVKAQDSHESSLRKSNPTVDRRKY